MDGGRCSQLAVESSNWVNETSSFLTHILEYMYTYTHYTHTACCCIVARVCADVLYARREYRLNPSILSGKCRTYRHFAKANHNFPPTRLILLFGYFCSRFNSITCIHSANVNRELQLRYIYIYIYAYRFYLSSAVLLPGTRNIIECETMFAYISYSFNSDRISTLHIRFKRL